MAPSSRKFTNYNFIFTILNELMSIYMYVVKALSPSITTPTRTVITAKNCPSKHFHVAHGRCEMLLAVYEWRSFRQEPTESVIVMCCVRT